MWLVKKLFGREIEYDIDVYITDALYVEFKHTDDIFYIKITEITCDIENQGINNLDDYCNAITPECLKICKNTVQVQLGELIVEYPIIRQKYNIVNTTFITIAPVEYVYNAHIIQPVGEYSEENMLLIAHEKLQGKVKYPCRGGCRNGLQSFKFPKIPNAKFFRCEIRIKSSCKISVLVGSDAQKKTIKCYDRVNDEVWVNALDNFYVKLVSKKCLCDDYGIVKVAVTAYSL
jgi:hypothetical protein